ncbi:glycosyltransferase family 4 protein [Clostridium perfringens]|uniref:glycosyltransferase family 4 protein n=1 Tax=Clostridium perfringens TaxID=1502 RepID=UPI00189939FA|nr:glycosyltransferase family 4 protein [Clostridium perfringens]MDM0445790.1 glycosyltransferase family 4 protein [Clostridium perfringens]MDM0451525.1 glycosyltransferase family 4 protein [Clostridium perfringens]
MKSKINIAIVAPNILPIPAVKGGAIETLMENLIKQNEIFNEIDLTIYTIFDSEAKKKSLQYKNTDFIFINEKKINARVYNFFRRVIMRVFSVNINSYYIKSILKDINKKDFNRIIVEGDKNNVIPLKKNKLGLGVYLHTHHDALKENSENLINECEKIIVVSKYIKEKTLSLNNVDKSKFIVLKNTIDTNLFNKNKYKNERDKIKKKFGVKDNEFIISFTGRLIPEKGIKELILAFKDIKTDKNIKLLIIGSSNFGLDTTNEYEYELQEISKEIKDNIIFTGFVHNDEVAKIHSIVDVAVVPSKCNEAAGIVVIEAISSGIPLIATNSGGIPEYIDKNNTILIENNIDLVRNLTDALNLLLNNDELFKKMNFNTRSNVKEYDNEFYYKNFINIINKVL